MLRLFYVILRHRTSSYVILRHGNRRGLLNISFYLSEPTNSSQALLISETKHAFLTNGELKFCTKRTDGQTQSWRRVQQHCLKIDNFVKNNDSLTIFNTTFRQEYFSFPSGGGLHKDALG